MKKLMLLLGMTLAGVSCEESDVYYTALYGVESVEAEIEMVAPDPTPEPTPHPEPTPDPQPEPSPEQPASGLGTACPTVGYAAHSDGTEEGTPTPEEELAAKIRQEIETTAPVRAGGSYLLDYTLYNGGRLQVKTSPEATPLEGEFFKEPGTQDYRFIFGDQNYVATYKRIAIHEDKPSAPKADGSKGGDGNTDGGSEGGNTDGGSEGGNTDGEESQGGGGTEGGETDGGEDKPQITRHVNCLEVDLTTYYQQRYPAQGIKKVVRREFLNQ